MICGCIQQNVHQIVLLGGLGMRLVALINTGVHYTYSILISVADANTCISSSGTTLIKNTPAPLSNDKDT